MNPLTLRRWHGYIGALIAPSVLFFALTGAVQLFGLHEAHGGYTPPPLIEKLSSVHKDQVFRAGHHHDHGPPPGAAAERPKPPADDDDDRMALSTALLKWVFLGVALGLTASTALGVWIALTRGRRERTVTLVLLAVGVVVPVVLLLAWGRPAQRPSRPPRYGPAISGGEPCPNTARPRRPTARC